MIELKGQLLALMASLQLLLLVMLRLHLPPLVVLLLQLLPLEMLPIRLLPLEMLPLHPLPLVILPLLQLLSLRLILPANTFLHPLFPFHLSCVLTARALHGTSAMTVMN